MASIRIAVGVEVVDHDGFDEVVEGAGVGAGAEAQDGLVGPLGADIRPVGGGGVDRSQLFEGHVGGEVILAADHDCQRIDADLEFDRGTSRANACTGFDLGVPDGAGGVGDVSLASYAEAFDASAGTDRVRS